MAGVGYGDELCIRYAVGDDFRGAGRGDFIVFADDDEGGRVDLGEGGARVWAVGQHLEAFDGGFRGGLGGPETDIAFDGGIVETGGLREIAGDDVGKNATAGFVNFLDQLAAFCFCCFVVGFCAGVN